MKKLFNDQNGAGHVVLVIAFVLVLAALVAFSYTRINDSNNNTETTASTSQSAGDENSTDPDENSSDDNAANSEDPSEVIDQEI